MMHTVRRCTVTVGRLLNRNNATSATAPSAQLGTKSQEVFDREDKFGAHNYGPVPVALAKGEG